METNKLTRSERLDIAVAVLAPAADIKEYLKVARRRDTAVVAELRELAAAVREGSHD